METWLKILLSIFFGGSLVIAIAWVALMFSGEPTKAEEVRNIPNQIDEIKQNATATIIDSGAQAIEQSSEEIIPAFQKAGEDMAKDVSDPGTKQTIIGGMTLAGILLSLFVALSIIAAILNALGIRVRRINA